MTTPGELQIKRLEHRAHEQELKRQRMDLELDRMREGRAEHRELRDLKLKLQQLLQEGREEEAAEMESAIEDLMLRLERRDTVR